MDEKMECAREKYWRELGLEEKVERLRGVVRQQSDAHEALLQAFKQLEIQFYAHSHDSRDAPVIPAVMPESPLGYNRIRNRYRIQDDADCFI